MNKGLKKSLPRELVTHVTAGCGRAGEQWLERLPETIRLLENLWSLRIGEPFPGIEFNYVAPAIMRGSQHVVVKVAPSWNPVDIYSEAAYLKCRKGHYAVEFLDENRESRAILIERVFPGQSLTECFKGLESESVAPAIDVLNNIIRPVSEAENNTVLLDKWFDGLRRYSSKGFPVAYAEKALDVYRSLSTQSDKMYYLHGDFHLGNVVSSTRFPFVAIDPKGIVGHVGYDIAVFLNNFHWWQAQKIDIRSVLDCAVHQFAEAFGISRFEVRQWAYAQMVLGAWWTYDEMPEIYDNEVIKADIWDV